MRASMTPPGGLSSVLDGGDDELASGLLSGQFRLGEPGAGLLAGSQAFAVVTWIAVAMGALNSMASSL